MLFSLSSGGIIPLYAPDAASVRKIFRNPLDSYVTSWFIIPLSGGIGMKTVKEMSKLTGISIRALHHYDAIDLLKPTQVTEAGYRLYDDAALEKLFMILVFRELGLSLKEIAAILHAPDFDRNRCLERQISLMQEQVNKLQDRITLAKGMLLIGVKNMNFEGFDPKKIDEYSTQAKVLYGKTDAYKEFEQKSAGRTAQQEKDLGAQVMDFFAKLGKLRPCDPACEAAQTWAKELQEFFTENFYTYTPQILASLAQSYAGGGSMTENIDAVGGAGTGAFAKEVIDLYIEKL
jgi:DNA-binding transcriptional MerR regulator